MVVMYLADLYARGPRNLYQKGGMRILMTGILAGYLFPLFCNPDLRRLIFSL
jgi:hypothetical protein